MNTDGVLQTARMTLRPFTGADVPCLAQILSDAEVMRYSVRGVLTESATAEFVQWSVESYAFHGFGPWAVVEQNTGVLMGFCALNQENVDGVGRFQADEKSARRARISLPKKASRTSPRMTSPHSGSSRRTHARPERL